MRELVLIRNHGRAEKILAEFEEVKVTHVQQATNAKADVLARLEASFPLPEGETLSIG